MREILFRGKKTGTNEWVNGSLISVCGKSYIEEQVRLSKSYEVDSDTVGQYTGFKDCKGKRVYEGDILYAKYYDKFEEKGFYETYNEVVFKNGAFGIVGKTTGALFSFDYVPINKYIVCSNIHDNKYLLK